MSQRPVAEVAGLNEQSAIYHLYTARSSWNVPAAFTSLVGREYEIAALVKLFRRPEIRLITLLGSGGIGKTRLSMQAASEVRHAFRDGVCFVALSTINTVEQVAPAIAEALGLQPRADMEISEQVAFFLSERQMLLILDNFEQISNAAPFLEELVGECPALKLLVTSREALHLQAEQLFPVAPLELPGAAQGLDSQQIAAYPAIALFVQRAQAVLPSFQLTPANAPAVVELCTRLDGLPLAIELAAARTRLLSPEAMLKRLAQRFQLLTSEVRTLPERHRTIFNTIKWSYDLLDEREQWLFRRLSIFVGGWTLEAAEAVCADSNDVDVLNGLTSLLDKSLLFRVEQQQEESRLQMLMTVREFGLECLRELGEMDQAQQRHAAYFTSLAEEAEPGLKGAGQLAWLTRLEQEHENLRAALEYLTGSRKAEMALRLCGALAIFWQRRGYWSEERSWLKAALELPTEHVQPAIRAKALSAAGELVRLQSDPHTARPLLEESIHLYSQSGDEAGRIRPSGLLGRLLLNQGDLEEGRSLVEESIALARKLNQAWELAWILWDYGHYSWITNNLERAVSLTEESLAIARELQDRQLTAAIMNNLAYMAWQQQNLARAEQLAMENLRLAREVNDKPLLDSTLETLGSIALERGDFARAQEYFVESFALARRLGRRIYYDYCFYMLARVAAGQGRFLLAARLYGKISHEFENILDIVLNESEQIEYRRSVDAVRAKLGKQAFAAAWEEGRALTYEQAVAELEDTRSSVTVPAVLQHRAAIQQLPAKPTYPDDLTPREIEVLRLLARGWTDAQIAEQLVISNRTVNKHTTSIYSKISVSSRSAATRYAIEHNLV